MSTNFLQWNPSANNQKNDTDYGNDTQRSGGAATNALFPSTTGNKLFYQLSTMVAALGQVISDYGHNASDADLSNLITALKNTFAKLNGNSGQVFEAANGASGKQVVNISQFAASLGANGYATIPVTYNSLNYSLIFQWGAYTNGINTWPLTWPHTMLGFAPAPASGGVSDDLKSWTAQQYTMDTGGNNAGIFMAIGY